MRFAIVIPTLNEESSLPRVLEQASRESDLVVISDGGSSDDTVALATARGAEVIVGDPGRGPQLDRGARLAIEHGALALLFLHADTQLAPGTRRTIERTLEQGAVGGGCLIRLSGDAHRGRLMRLAPRLVNWRTRRFCIPLGDQAQFVTAAAYLDTGGFRDIPILEDLDFIRRLKNHGPVVIPDVHVAPDTRRFASAGVVRTVMRNWAIFLLFYAGVSPNRLAKLYRADVR